MKKKLIQLAVVATLACGLTACGGKENTHQNSSIDIDVNDSTDVEIVTTEENNPADGALLDDPEVEQKIDEINLYIDLYYYNEIDREKQEEALYDGIMQGLDDPYAGYYTPEEFS